jgi:hypothetical protein
VGGGGGGRREERGVCESALFEILHSTRSSLLHARSATMAQSITIIAVTSRLAHLLLRPALVRTSCFAVYVVCVYAPSFWDRVRVFGLGGAECKFVLVFAMAKTLFDQRIFNYFQSPSIPSLPLWEGACLWAWRRGMRRHSGTECVSLAWVARNANSFLFFGFTICFLIQVREFHLSKIY